MLLKSWYYTIWFFFCKYVDINLSALYYRIYYKESNIEKLLIDIEEDLEHAHDHLLGMLDILYGKGDISDLESCLEEVCAVFGINIPTGKLLVRKD